MNRFNANKVLLVHPLGYPARAADRDISRIANMMPPLGLASIASYLKNRNIDSAIIDCFARPESDLLIGDYLRQEKPAFIGLSCTTSSFLDGIRISAIAKEILPGIKAVFGGPHISALKEQLVKNYPQIDFSVIGEGEQTFADLIDCEADGVADIPGLVYRNPSGEVSFSGYRPKSLDLDVLPFPAYDKLDGFPRTYSLPIFNYPSTPNTSCISSRGCPYSCSYCDRSVYRRTFRYNSSEYMYEHLRYLRKHFGIRHINFYDDLFTFNRKRIEEFTHMLINRPLGMTFNCAARAEHVDKELLKRMKAAGCWMISLGIETGDETLLSRHRQNADLQMLAEKIHLLKKVGIRTKGLLMMGLPGETNASIQKSMDYVNSLKLDDFNLSKFTPFPGSPLYEKIHEYGTFNEDWEKMDCMHFQFIPEGMKKEQMEKSFKYFYKKHYMHPRVLWGYVTMLWKSPDSWLRFFLHLRRFIQFARSNKRQAEFS